MKRIAFMASVAAIVFMIGGCSAPAYVQKDDSFNRSTYKTYMWVDTRASENDESKRATAYADISLHNAVNEELDKWGWKEVSDNPDVIVSYDVLVERSTETQRDPVYSQPMVRYYYNAYRRRWTPIYYPSQFVGYQEYDTPVKDGTVTITIMDAQSDKKLWQGWTTDRMSGNGFDEVDVRKSVRNIFKQA